MPNNEQTDFYLDMATIFLLGFIIYVLYQTTCDILKNLMNYFFYVFSI